MADETVDLSILKNDGVGSLNEETPPEVEPEQDFEPEQEEAEEQQEEQEESLDEEEPSPNPPAEEVVVDYVSLFGEGYDTPDKVKQEITRAKDLERQLEEAKKATLTYADPMVERLDGILKANPGINRQIAVTLSSLDAEKLKGMDDTKLLKLNMQLEDPNLIGNDMLIDRKMGKKYYFMPSDEALEDMSDDERREVELDFELSQLELRADAQKVRDKLAGMMPTRTTVTPEDIQARRQALESEWKEPSKTIISKEISIPDGEWDKELLKYGIEQSEFDSIVASVPQIAANNNLALTEENFKAISGQILSNYVMGNLPKIVKAVKEKVRAETILEVEKKYNNPSAKRSESKGTRKEGDVNLSPLTS